MAQKDVNEQHPLSGYLEEMNLNDSAQGYSVKLNSLKYSNSKESEYNNNSEKSTTTTTSTPHIPGESFKRVSTTLGSSSGHVSEESSWSPCRADEVSEEIYVLTITYY